MSLANVLAVARAARNLVLLGDPQQLAQPSQATHPPGAGASALGHILGERATMPEDAGLLLDLTYRMHPDLRRYTSEVFYDGKLHGVEGLGRQEILGDPPSSVRRPGLRSVEVLHQGNTNASPEEADEVARLVGDARGLLVAGPVRCGAAGRLRRHPHRDAVQRANQGHPGRAGGPRPDRVQGRHCRQVPGPRGPSSDLFDGHLVSRRGAAWPGISLRSAPAERGDLAGQGDGGHRGQPRPTGCPARHRTR